MFPEMNSFNYDPFVNDNGSPSSVKLPPLNLYWTHQDQSILDDDVFVTDFTDLVSSCNQHNPNMMVTIKEEEDQQQQQQRDQGDFFTDLNPSPLYSSSDSGFYYSSSCSYSSTSSDCWGTVSSPGSCSSSLIQSPSSASSQYHQEQAFPFPPDADWLAGQQQQCHNQQQQMQQFIDQQQQPEEDLITLDDEDDEEDEPRVLHCRWIDCKCSFNSQENLVQHIERSHVDQRRAEDFTCFWAGCPRRHRPFNARYKLLIHMRVHSGEKPNRCSYDGCTKAFSRLENLKIHLRSHTGEKPYLCQYPTCRKTFSNSSDRAKHQRTHIDTKPYACQVPGCLKRYTDPSSLRKHVKNHVNKQYDSSDVKPAVRSNSTPSVKSAKPRRILSHSEEDHYQSRRSSYDESSLWNNQGSIDFINMNQTEQQVIDESILLEDESLLLTEMNRYVQDENDGWMFPTGDDMERLCGLSFV